MVTVLGPESINEDIFTSFGHTLGLDWDLDQGIRSMPTRKIAKALDRVTNMLQLGKATRTPMNRFLGSLRHICTCIRRARAYFQRLSAFLRRVKLQPGAHSLLETEMEDLRWFTLVLNQPQLLQGVPFEHFDANPVIDHHISMDASGVGFCALDPQRHSPRIYPCGSISI